MKNLTLLTVFLFSSILISFAQVDTAFNKLGGPLGMASDGNYIYVAEAYSNQISRVDLNNPTDSSLVIVNGVGKPNYLAISGQYLYFTEYNGAKISRVNIQIPGASHETVLSPVNSPNDIIIVGNTLYYSHPYGISKIDISSATPNSVDVKTGLNGPIGMAYKDNYIYYSEFPSNKISKINVTFPNPTPTVVVSGLSGPYGGMTITGNDLYFIELTSKKISYIDITSSSPTVTNFASDVDGGDVMFIGIDLYVTNFMHSCILRFNNVLEIDNLSNNKDIPHIYPIPGIDVLHIESKNSIPPYVVYNLAGVNVFETENSDQKTLDIKGLPAGVYFIRFENKATQKFIIQ